MFFKKKVPVREYCEQNLAAMFSQEREATWDALRESCGDPKLSDVQAKTYYNHLRAVFVQLLLIAVAKNASMDASSDAHMCVMIWLKENNAAEIDDIMKGSNGAFASSSLGPNGDGVAAMVAHFSKVLAGGDLKQSTNEQLLAEFYAILEVFFDDFKNIKLLPRF